MSQTQLLLNSVHLQLISLQRKCARILLCSVNSVVGFKVKMKQEHKYEVSNPRTRELIPP